MKLLIDQNLSFRLSKNLAAEFPESVHVRELGMEEFDDDAILGYAVENDFCILTKDSDYIGLVTFGGKGKAILLKMGNCSTQSVTLVLKNSTDAVQVLENQETGVLILP